MASRSESVVGDRTRRRPVHADDSAAAGHDRPDTVVRTRGFSPDRGYGRRDGPRPTGDRPKTPATAAATDRSGATVRLIATTNRGFESVSTDEVAGLVSASPSVVWPGAIAFEGDESTLYRLHARARTINRVLVEVAAGPVDGLDDVAALVGTATIPEYVAPGRPFAVRSTRHGDHPFTSMDVADRVGRATIDAVRAAGGDLPVDLDDPDTILRVFVREDYAWLAVDVTGGRSLHRRGYRTVEHEAPLRPTMAAALCRLAGVDDGTSVLDPTCGCGAIPIEAALLARDRPPVPDRQFAFDAVPFADVDQFRAVRDDHPTRGRCPPIRGIDVEDRWIAGAHRNAAAAGVDDDVAFELGDATATTPSADLVIADLPFGVRTDGTGLDTLYRGLFDALGDEPERVVVFTARDDLVPVEPTRRLDVRHGRLDAAVLIVE
ncbi:hypothetical protein BRD17_00040 [Halobacteriales archaeon SW_7_68_16]|nr:MAG: hypothetical protein BRD17_00040 [Halobacteriales archaeon SW_7_68_16]